MLGCCLDFTGINGNTSGTGCTICAAGGKGGITKIYIACASDLTSAPTKDSTTDEVTSINFGSTNPFKEFDFNKETGSFTVTPSINDSTGGISYDSTVSVQFGRMDSDKRLQLQNIAASDLVIVVQDSNGTKWLLGWDECVQDWGGVAVSGGTYGSGTAMSDFNGFQVEFAYNSLTIPYVYNPGSSWQ